MSTLPDPGLDYLRVATGKIMEMWREVDQLGTMEPNSNITTAAERSAWLHSLGSLMYWAPYWSQRNMEQVDTSSPARFCAFDGFHSQVVRFGLGFPNEAHKYLETL